MSKNCVSALKIRSSHWLSSPADCLSYEQTYPKYSMPAGSIFENLTDIHTFTVTYANTIIRSHFQLSPEVGKFLRTSRSDCDIHAFS